MADRVGRWVHSYQESRILEVAGGVMMEGDILAYLNQKEFPTYVSSFIVDFVLLVFSNRTSFCLSIFARRWSDFSSKQHAQLRMSRVW